MPSRALFASITLREAPIWDISDKAFRAGPNTPTVRSSNTQTLVKYWIVRTEDFLFKSFNQRSRYHYGPLLQPHGTILLHRPYQLLRLGAFIPRVDATISKFWLGP